MDVDGTFTKEISSLTVLLAVSVDADNYVVMTALALVEGESESSWRWFLSHLHTAISNLNSPRTTIMSDRDKGLRAADNEIPLANRAFCIEHISRDIQKNYGVPFRVAFNAHIRFSPTEQRVRTGFAKLRDISPQAAAYLEDIPLGTLGNPLSFWEMIRPQHFKPRRGDEQVDSGGTTTIGA